MHAENTKADKRLPAAKRREVILDAASRTFTEFGYHGANMETIAERANVTKPILYRHFPSKLSLLIALLKHAGEELRDSMLRPTQEGEDWRTSIRKDVRSFLDFVENYEAGFRLIYSVGLSIDREVSEYVDFIRHINREIVAERIRYFTDTDSVPPEDIEVLAAMVVGMAETTALFWISNEKAPREVCEKNLVQAITDVLAFLPARVR
jgi:AcrR family transcriptional regulator